MILPAFLPLPFYTGEISELSLQVPSLYPVGLAGRGYNLDLDMGQFAHVSIPLLKPQQDAGNQVSESSLNPEGLWRRSQDSWHKGAGQTYLDKPDSDMQGSAPPSALTPGKRGN
jgi:hypothetical protein